MKILFLDIDGVMRTLKRHPAGWRYAFDQSAVQALNQLTRETGAKVVISSTWRELGLNLPEIFRLNGVQAEIVGYTPVLSGFCRGVEIEAWLDVTSKPVTGYVILDDDNDMGSLGKHLVQTEPGIGLTIEDVRRAVEILGRGSGGPVIRSEQVGWCG